VFLEIISTQKMEIKQMRKGKLWRIDDVPAVNDCKSGMVEVCCNLT
jgi:hypothetical protein